MPPESKTALSVQSVGQEAVYAGTNSKEGRLYSVSKCLFLEDGRFTSSRTEFVRKLTQEDVDLSTMIARRILRCWYAPDHHITELLTEVNFALYKAAKTWDETGGCPWPSWLRLKITRHFQDYLREKTKSRRKCEPLSFTPLTDRMISKIGTDETPETIFANREEREWLLGALRRYDLRLSLVVKSKLDGLTHRDIGLVFGVSESRISQLYTEAVKYLRSLDHTGLISVP